MTSLSEKSLSDLWRENKSRDAGTELASILDGCRILAQSLVPEAEVTFAGVETAQTDKKRIFLSPKLLGNKYPVPGDIVDCLLGLTVHEVGHILFSQDRVQYTEKLATKAGCRYKRPDYDMFKDLVNIFEDIYIDHLMTAYPGYRDYLQKERAWALGKFNPDNITKPLEAKSTMRDMLNALIYFTLAGGKMPRGISQENLDTLGKIAKYANKMCTKKTSKGSAILGAWKVLKELPTTLSDEDRGFTSEPQIGPEPGEGEIEPEAKPISEQLQEDVTSELETQDELEKKEEKIEQEDVVSELEMQDELGKEEEEIRQENVTGELEIQDELEEEQKIEDKVDEEPELDPQLDLASRLDVLVEDMARLPEELAKEVSEAIIEKRSDLTELLSYLAKDSHYTVLAYTPKEDAERAVEARKQTAPVEEKLRRILQDYRTRRTRDYRGLMSGRISSRRLHRAAYGDLRVFQRRERPEEIDMAVCLLMDLSGSVHHYRPLIEQITCAISDAFTKEKMEFISLGYSEGHNKVYIPRLYDREVGRVKLGLEKEWGMTPSYEGLAAAIAQLLRLSDKKQKVLFHFTDGEPNVAGQKTIPELLEDARGRGIIDIHICLSASDISGERFRSLYGGEDTMVIKEINQLPEVIDKELRRRLKI